MGSFPSAFPFSLDDTTTLLDLERLVAGELGYAQGIPSSAGTTTTLIDASGDSPIDPNDSEQWMNNAWLKIEEDTNGQNVGEVRRISSVSTSTSTFTISRAYTNATSTTMTYGVYPVVPPTRMGGKKGLDEYINEVLRRLKYRNRYLLTLCPDGDMEASGTAQWTASNSTLTKVGTYVTMGKQALHVENSSAGGYVQSGNIAVTPTKTVDVVVDLSVASGTVTLDLRDITNGTSIDTVSSTDLNTSYLWLPSNAIPSGCKNIAVRCTGTESSADFYLDNVSVRHTSARMMPMPSWYLESCMIEEMEIWDGGSPTASGGPAPVIERYKGYVHWFDELEDKGGDVPFYVLFDQGIPATCHLFARVVRPYTQLTSDSDTTSANQDWVKAWALRNICRDLEQAAEYQRWKDMSIALHARYQPKFVRRRMSPGNF